MILKARGPGKFCSSRTAETKVGKIDKIFRKVPSGAIYLNFLGPAGGSRTRKGAFALQENTIWLVETEIADWMFFQRALWIHKRIFRDNIGGDLDW